MKRSDGMNPLLLYSNADCGYAIPDDFNSEMASLLDRGFFIANAHVRGGGELGVDWRNNGRLMKKKNAISDYFDCAAFLINHGYTSKGMITAISNDAGGLITAAVVNEHPDLFKAAVLSNPLTDPITFLSDSAGNKDIADKWKEFGNPVVREQFEYLYSYSPYDNIKQQNYPPMLFRTSIGDKKAAYSGPLKMVARLRKYKTDKNILLIKIDSTGIRHGLAGEKATRLIQAENRAFILDQYGIKE